MPESNNLYLWVGFNIYILAMLAFSMVAHRGQERISIKSAALWSLFWVANGLAVNALIWWMWGSERGLEFTAGFIIEESLSVDNLFVILTIFHYFSIPPSRQQRVLFWGILGAIILRGAFILAGSALVTHFSWILYIFGAFLVYTGFKLFREDEEHEIVPDKNIFVRAFRRLVPVDTAAGQEHFFVRKDGRWHASTLFIALLVVESSDVMFAFDSIPAIFSITTDPFIVFSSNICAVLGLRSLYFLLQEVMGLFRFLRVGLALVLTFVGIKMLVADLIHIPVAVSLGVVGVILGLTVVTSLIWKKPAAPSEPPQDS